MWLSGPDFLREASPNRAPTAETIPLDTQDPEVRSEVTTHITGVKGAPGLGL